ncbi:MAG TPA: hypothetical protein PLQ98_00360 [Bacillota bacterium]|nr:hypothetical protein [Bacillota bacterium]
MATKNANFTQIGKTGFKHYSGYIYDEFLTSLQGAQGVKVYREMYDNDPIVGAAIQAIERLIASVQWYVEPASSKRVDKNAAVFVKECMTDMSHTWNSFIENVTSMLVYGWSYFEIVYKLRKKGASKYTDGRIGWRKIEIRKQSSLDHWELEDDGGVLGMWQAPPPDLQSVYIPIQKAILFRTKTDNPEGRSVLRNAYRPWFIKKNIEEIEAVGVERDLIGLPVLYLPEGLDLDSNDPDTAALRHRLEELIKSLRRDEQDGLALPFGWDIKLLGGSGSSRRQFDVDRIVNRYDKRIAASLLSQFIMLGMDRVGSFALSRNQNEVFLIAVQGYLENIAETINIHLIPRLFELNPGFARMSDYPQVLPGRVVKEDADRVSQFIERLARAGFIAPDDVDRDELLRIGGVGETYRRKTKIVDVEDERDRERYRSRERDQERDGNGMRRRRRPELGPAEETEDAESEQ